jgi:hypothetical protein
MTKQNSSGSRIKLLWNKTWVRVVLIVVVVLVIIRFIVLPPVVLHYVNKSLAELKDYYGHVDDIDIALIRGAYTLNNIYINAIDSATRKETPFFNSRIVDLSVEWGALLHGKVVGEMIFEDADLSFTKDKTDPADVQKDTGQFHRLRKQLMPLRVNRCEIRDGRLHYVDSTAKPPVNIWLNDMHLLAHNLINVVDTSLLPAKIVADAGLYDGKLNFNMKLNPLAFNPTFDMNAKLENTSLPKVNNFFKAYGKFDVHSGTFGLYTELAAKDGKFVGYVKPVIKDLKILGPEDRKDNILRKIWEGIVGAAAMVLKNPEEKQIATKVPIEGSFDKTTVGVWYAVLDLLHNAFIQALQPSIDYQIDIESVHSKNIVQKEDRDKTRGKDKKDKK